MHSTSTLYDAFDATLVSDAIRSRLEAGGDASVHSVFASVVNLHTPDGLLTITGPTVLPLPHGLAIHARIDFRATRLRVGQRVVMDRTRLGFPAANLEVDLSHAAGWSPRLASTDSGKAAARWRARAASVRRLAANVVRDRRGASDGLGSLIDQGSGPLGPVARLAAPRLERISDALRAADPEAAAAAAATIVGLGPGLTPSGDDVLVGIAAGVAALATIGSVDATFLRPAADSATLRTTAVGAAFLRHAADGEFAGGLHLLIGALVGPEAASIRAAVERAASFGATSGADTLVGVFLGLDALAGVGHRLDRVAA